jgi:hypothetical protein
MDILDAIYKKRHNNKFINPQMIFKNGEDSPLNGGLANGVE